MKKIVYASLSSILFSLGLMLSGMTQPAKVLGFLNISGIAQGISWAAESGRWNPSLAFVMGGALMVTLIAFAITPKRAKPWAAERFELPTREDIDAPLLIGAALFGAGWGLAGYCPGPALASLFVSWDAVVFAVSMLIGMVFIRRVSLS